MTAECFERAFGRRSQREAVTRLQLVSHRPLDKRQRRGLPVLVAVSEDEVIGFSSFGEWRSRWGYRYTVEHSVHVRANRRGQGVGRVLIEALFPRAAALGMHVMIAQIDSEATVSRHLHQKLGFELVGTFRQAAHKFGRWLDLIAMQRTL